MNTAVHSPFFSIIIPTYNRAHLIMDTIKSIQSQSYTNWELIVVDDGSTDETTELFEKITDERIKYHFKKNEERNIARNFGFSKSVGKYILFFDSDDLMLNKHLESLSEIILTKNSPYIIECGFMFKNISYGYSKYVGLTRDEKLTLMCDHNWLPIQCSCIDRSLIQNPFFYPDKRFILSEDLFVWLKLLKKYDVFLSDHIGVEIVQHDGRSLSDWSYSKYEFATKTILRESVENLSQKQWKSLAATHHSMTALSAAKTGPLKKVFSHYYIAVKYNFKLLLHKRLPAVIKNLFLRVVRRLCC